MFCPTCGKKIPEPVAFCPQCGGKLPKIEKMAVNPDELSAEEASAAARSGFDRGKPFLTTKGGGQVPPVNGVPVKQKPKVFAVVFAIAAIIIAAIIMFKGGGTLRNCIGSIIGAPECSD